MILLSITSIIPKLPRPSTQRTPSVVRGVVSFDVGDENVVVDVNVNDNVDGDDVDILRCKFHRRNWLSNETKRNSSFLFFMVALSSQRSPILPLASALTASAFLATCTDGSINFENFNVFVAE